MEPQQYDGFGEGNRGARPAAAHDYDDGVARSGPPRAYPRQEIDSELTLGMKKAGVALVAAPEPDRRDVRAPPPTQTQLDAQ